MHLATALLATLGWMTAVMLAAWAAQRTVRNSGWIDVFWTAGTGAAGVAVALYGSPESALERQVLVAALIGVWSARLAAHVAVRVARSPSEDARYARYRAAWGAGYERKILVLTLPQAAITTAMMASVALAAWRPGALDWRDGAGLLVLSVAIAGESLADRQLAAFRRGASGQINQVGLWGWSRHPNYFFEWLGWLAYPVMALDLARPLSLLTLAAPAMMFVVLRYITGVPPLEATMLQSRGEAFRRYQRRVSPFFPLPPKRETVA